MAAAAAIVDIALHSLKAFNKVLVTFFRRFSDALTTFCDVLALVDVYLICFAKFSTQTASEPASEPASHDCKHYNERL